VIRCWISRQPSDSATQRIADYLKSALRVLRGILSASTDSRDYTAFFRLVVAIVSVGGVILPLVIDESLTLLSDLIQLRCWEVKKGFDFRQILIASILTCRNVKVLVTFLINMFDLPSEILSTTCDFSLYLIVFAPLLCGSLDSPQALATICEYSDFRRAIDNIKKHFKSTHIAAVLNDLRSSSSQTFAFNLIHTLAPLTTLRTIETAAHMLSALMHTFVDFSIPGIFDLGCALLSFSKAKTVIDGLSCLTSEATLNERSNLCASKIRFLQAISNCSEGQRFLERSRQKSTNLSLDWEAEFRVIQNSMKSTSVYQSPEKIYKARFDSIENFPPIFPFESEFLQCEIVREVTNFCRRIQVNPQSNWAFSLYCATDVSECKAREDADSPELSLDVPFNSILETTLNEIIEEEAESLSEGEVEGEKDQAGTVPARQIYSFGEGENRTYSVEIEAFLPELAIVDDFMGLGDEKHFAIHTSAMS
jgi:hypothetical protein